MKKVFLLLLLAITAHAVRAGQEQKIELDSKHTLIATVSTNLDVQAVHGKSGWNAAMIISDKAKNSQMRLFIKPAPKSETKEKLTEKLVDAAKAQFLPHSVEKDIVTQEKAGKAFSLTYFQLTDSRPEEKDGKYLTQGIGLHSPYLMEFFMLSKDKTAAETEILDCLADLRIEETK